jgi:Kef-type K+ transport system membrane component KefB
MRQPLGLAGQIFVIVATIGGLWLFGNYIVHPFFQWLKVEHTAIGVILCLVIVVPLFGAAAVSVWRRSRRRQ